MRYLTALCIASSLVAAQNVDLDTIVVSATKSEQKIADVTSDIIVITKEELEEKHISTVLEALKEAQGLIVTQNGGLGQNSSVFVRGFGSEYTLILIDGIKINDPTTPQGAAEISYLTLNNIDRIEIVKGAQSGIYGANAAAGVINIITKKSNKDCDANIQLEYGQFNTKTIQTALSKKLGKASLALAYTKITSDGFSAQADITKDLDDYEDDSYKNETFNTKFSYNFTSNDKLDIESIKIDATTEYDGYPITDQEGYVVESTNRLNKVVFTHNYSENMYSRLFYTKTLLDRKYSKNFPQNYSGENIEYGLDNKIALSYADILFGFNKQKIKDKINNTNLDSKGIYLTANSKYKNSLVSATLRRDFYDEFKDKTTGKIGIKHFFDNGLIFRSNYGTAYRAPSLFEYQNRLDNTLKPETIKGFDIGLEYKNFTLSYFDNDIEDLITYSLDQNWQVHYYNSNGKSTIKGFELGYKGVLAQDLLYNINYTRYIAKDSKGYQLVRRPNYIINANLDYYGFEDFHINLNAQYVGDKIDNDYSTYPTIKKVHIGHVFVANLAADYQITKDLEAYVKINNITDRKYQDVYGYATSPRAIYVGINAKF